MDASEAHRNATMSLLLPGKVLHLNALLALRKFRDRDNKAGAVRGFETLQESNLGRLISLKPQRGATMVNCNTLCANWASSNQKCYGCVIGQFEEWLTLVQVASFPSLAHLSLAVRNSRLRPGSFIMWYLPQDAFLCQQIKMLPSPCNNEGVRSWNKWSKYDRL